MEISRWAFTQTIREVACPKCHVAAEFVCRTPSGRKAPIPHGEREMAYTAKIGREEWNRRHSYKPTKEDLQRPL